MLSHPFGALILAMGLVGNVVAQDGKQLGPDLPGVPDPTIVTRVKGSVLYNFSDEKYTKFNVLTAPGYRFENSKYVFQNVLALEGRVRAYHYSLPVDAAMLEVYRSYVSALSQAGFAKIYQCEMEACRAANVNEGYGREIFHARKWADSRMPPESSAPRDLLYWSGKATKSGDDVYVVVWVRNATSVGSAAANVFVIEPKPMETGLVTASLEQLRAGIQSEGKVVLPGVFFDTGKAEIKPDSRPQLEEIAKLLKADPALKVFIVGHTDNQGSFDNNIQLSQRRADAVVAALAAAPHSVNANRMVARGVANVSPLATNGTETGRAKNRRVEMVSQ